ncbi:hypothetical protein L227DRAFT_565512 [Lentinus tigrinus ALCF2SS1-6]|uniref:DUF6533 domain-containing protein n=1 Tax=Lentinus tigrinus ALCF2SS1-6 TaxID=1328759 RepID=A0A5C2S306_9APHY|nr:hypothetical protein L227DRAFT_565512 [Lentinus tigrinus ALCF2SS1-6]
MSGQAYDPALAADYYNFLVGNYCTLAAFTMFIYEYVITFGAEVDLFWTKRLTGATVLFFLNRGIVMFYTWYDLIVGLFTIPATSKYIPSAAFSALRVYALIRNWYISVLVFVLSVVPVAINFTTFAFDFEGILAPPFGCIPSDTVGTGLGNRYYLFRVRVNSGSPPEKLHSLANRVVLLQNVLHLTLTLLSVSKVTHTVSVVTQFTEPITAILVSRFLIDLQVANQESLENSVGPSESLVFERVIGSLGSSIGPVVGTDDTDDAGSSDELPTEVPYENASHSSTNVDKGKERED